MDTTQKQHGSRIKALLAGLILGALGGMAGMYLHLRDRAPAPGTPVVGPNNCAGPSQAKAPAAPEPTKEAKDFDFYGVLENTPAPPTPRPDLESSPLPPAVGASRAPSAPSTPASPVYLQIASFKTTADADALKARIALAGQPASVVSMDLPGKGTYYRVRVGPFANKEEALRAGTLMQQAGIDPSGAILVR